MKWSKSVLSIASIAVLGILALGITSTPAFAASTTANLGISANVSATCVAGTTAVQFGPYTGATSVSAIGAVTVTCTNSTTYTVSLNAGNGSTATVAIRQMQNGSALLNYALYKDSVMSILWGDGTTGTFTVAGTGNGQAQPISVYGQIPALQYPTPGSYVDSVLATISY
jgi:spore coat protein U-like protein